MFKRTRTRRRAGGGLHAVLLTAILFTMLGATPGGAIAADRDEAGESSRVEAIDVEVERIEEPMREETIEVAIDAPVDAPADPDAPAEDEPTGDPALDPTVVAEPAPRETPESEKLPDLENTEVDIYVTPIVLGDEHATGSVSVSKFGCPGSFGGDEAKLAFHCTSMDAPFKVYSTNANDVFSGSFSLDVDPGPVVISEEVPTGWIEPIVYCDQTTGIDGSHLAFAPQLASGDTVTIDVDAGDVLDCRWYNIPELGKAHLTINKHTCPDGFYPYASDWAGIAAPCSPLMNGVPFAATFPNGSVFNQTTGDLGDGLIYWMQIPAGVYTVDETVPAGYGEPLVHCIRRDVDTDAVQEVFQATVYMGYRINVELYDDSNLFCDWYNVPFTGDGVIQINKHDCPLGTPGAADQATLESECVNDQNGITFTVSNGAGLKLEQKTGSIYNSRVFVDHLPGGTYSLTEKVPSGYGTPAVFCGTVEHFEAEVVSINVEQSGSTVKVALPEGGIVVCDWYNIPG